MVLYSDCSFIENQSIGRSLHLPPSSRREFLFNHTTMETHQQQESLITSFIEITSSSKEEAVFFLESHNYDLDSAVSTFLDNSSHAAIPASAPHHPIQSPSPVNSSPESSSSPPPPSNPVSRSSPYGLRSTKEKLAASSSSKSINKKRTTRSSSGVRTLADLNRKNGDDGDEDDDEDGDDSDDSDYDERQEYYAGGERSGMLVQDPSRHNDVDSIFNQARQLGAVEGSSDSLRPSSGKKNFTGTGRLLSGETIPADPQRPESVTHTIIFWSNGFTVDDGPLRMLDDPQNENFLESIKKGECPKELELADRRTPVNVNLTRKEENYVEPKKPHVPFRGAGRTLGSSTDAADSDPPVSVTLSSAPSSDVGLVIDENLRLTSIQIRLADGTRMVSRFNYHHTVGDIRDFIDASRPGGSRNYQLQMMGFPPKQLTDPTRTIEQDGLANSVVIQKF